jgi:phospholipase/carboxylesterase
VRAAGADPDRVFLVGFSQGAILSLGLLLTRPDLVAGAVAWSGRILPEWYDRRAAGPLLESRPALVIHGVNDQTLPVQHGRASRARLEAVPLRRLAYQEFPMGHQVSAESLACTNAWLRQAVAAGQPGGAG